MLRRGLGIIVGVVSSAADCYAKSLEAGACVCTDSADTLADGMAVRVPSPEALEIMRGNVAQPSRGAVRDACKNIMAMPARLVNGEPGLEEIYTAMLLQRARHDRSAGRPSSHAGK